MTIPVGWLAPGDQWDTTMLRALLDSDEHGLKFKHHIGFPNTDDHAVVCVPGRYWAQHTDQINEAIQRFVSVLLIVTSDEEGLFPLEEVAHPRLKAWVQTPRRDYQPDVRLFGVGYSPHFANLPTERPVKDTDVFLAAQKSNALTGRHFKVYERRAAWFKALKHGAWSKNLVERDGFAQGDRAEYVSGMLAAKIAPAPTGMVSVDSFRFWEALEAGCIPIADGVSDVDGSTQYWARLFGEDIPFPVLTDIADLPSVVDGLLEDWPANAERIAAWYASYKRCLASWLREDLHQLGAV